MQERIGDRLVACQDDSAAFTRDLWVAERLLQPVVVAVIVQGVRGRNVGRRSGVECVNLPDPVRDIRERDERVPFRLPLSSQPGEIGEVDRSQVQTKHALGADRSKPSGDEEARPLVVARPRLERLRAEIGQMCPAGVVELGAEPAAAFRGPHECPELGDMLRTRLPLEPGA